MTVTLQWHEAHGLGVHWLDVGAQPALKSPTHSPAFHSSSLGSEGQRCRTKESKLVCMDLHHPGKNQPGVGTTAATGEFTHSAFS